MLTRAINSVRVREYPLRCKKSWDNGTISHHFYHALLPKLVWHYCLLNGIHSWKYLGCIKHVKSTVWLSWRLERAFIHHDRTMLSLSLKNAIPLMYPSPSTNTIWFQENPSQITVLTFQNDGWVEHDINGIDTTLARCFIYIYIVYRIVLRINIV